MYVKGGYTLIIVMAAVYITGALGGRVWAQQNNEAQAKTHYATGLKALKDNKFPEAIESLRKASQLDPRFAQMVEDWLPSATRAADKGDDATAINYYKVCLALDMNSMEVHEGLIAILKKSGDAKFRISYAEIKTAYPKSTAILDSIPGRYFQQGMQLAKKGDFVGALSKYKEAEYYNPSYKSLAAEIKGCNDSIANQKRIEENKKLAKSNYDNGMKELAAGKYEDAVALFKKAGELDASYNNYMDVIKEQGLAEIKSNKLESGAPKLGLVLTNNVGNADLHKQLIDACIANNNIDFLTDVYSSLLIEYPFESVLREVLPEYYYKQGAVLKSQSKAKALLAFRVVQMLKPSYQDVGDQIDKLQ